MPRGSGQERMAFEVRVGRPVTVPVGANEHGPAGDLIRQDLGTMDRPLAASHHVDDDAVEIGKPLEAWKALARGAVLAFCRRRAWPRIA
jgi:hypothetical protein